ncbi:MFS transporter [Allorhizocola rhizosphaerae]|uniref:MFS transporter n=1 Tax=Allorhizocola rhizosphaerae TaxID=1872709 RepID=UPI000E3D8025|nr:MFS transporter [Allorhizocola rhizosphaerae]
MSDRSVISARWAVATIFAVHGVVSGSFAARIPWIKEHLMLSDGQLGLALVMPALGSLTTMPFAGRLVTRFGGRATTRVLISLWSLALIIIPLAPNRWVLMFFLLLGGAAAGTSDMAMNAEAVAVEKAMRRSIMSGLHGMWSVGGLIGAGIGAGAAKLAIGAPANLAVVGAVVLVIGYAAGHRLFPAAPVSNEDGGPRFSFPRGPVLIIGLIGFCAIVAESASADWAAVYLIEILGAGEAVGALAFAAFAFSMAAGRLAGDFVVTRFGAVGTVRAAGLMGVVGGILVVTALSPLLATIGFGMIGIGVAVVVPLAFSAAGHTGEHPTHAIAGVATVSYGAGLAAPGMIGGIAAVTSLQFSFALVTGFVAIVVLGARRLRAATL